MAMDFIVIISVGIVVVVVVASVPTMLTKT